MYLLKWNQYRRNGSLLEKNLARLISKILKFHAPVAQLAELRTLNARVAGSNPAGGIWAISSMAERLVYIQEVRGSNPLLPINEINRTLKTEKFFVFKNCHFENFMISYL